MGREVEESWETGLGREVWARLLRDLNSKQGVWNFIAKGSLKKLARGVRNLSAVFRRVMCRFCAGGVEPGGHFGGFHLVQVR